MIYGVKKSKQKEEKMKFEEPKVEFIPVDTNDAVFTKVSKCDDSVTDGGTYCVDSYATSECGDKMPITN